MASPDDLRRDKPGDKKPLGPPGPPGPSPLASTSTLAKPGATGDVAAAAASIFSGGTADDESGVREALQESAHLARATASARARVAALRARGASLPELDGRLAAAELLSKRREPDAAL